MPFRIASLTAMLLAAGHAWPRPASAQRASPESAILAAIASGDSAATERLLADVALTGQHKLGGTNQVSVLRFAMLHDDMGVFRAVLRRSLPITPADLAFAGGKGTSAQFLALLLSAPWHGLDSLAEGRTIAVPVADSSRRLAAQALLRNPAVDIDKLAWAPRGSDTVAIDRWLDRMARTTSSEKFTTFAAQLALQLSHDSPGGGAEYLLDRFVYDRNGDLNFIDGKAYLVRAFERGNWRLVETLLRRGVSPIALEQVDSKAIVDPDRALGYYVRSQLIDLDSNHRALAANQAWKPPAWELWIGPLADALAGWRIVWPDKWTSKVGNTGEVTGLCGMSPTVPGFGILGGKVNGDFFPGSAVYVTHCSQTIRLVIPASDTTTWGEYHSLAVENYGAYQYSPQPSKGSDEPVEVWRGNLLIATAKLGEQVVVNRAFGPIEVRTRTTPLRNNGTFGIRFRFGHVVQPKVAADIRARLDAYRQLMTAAREEAAMTAGTPAAYDARTRRRLLSEALGEAGAQQAVREAARLALQTLAEQSVFDAALTQFLNDDSRVLGFDLPDVLRQLPSDSPPTVRRQVDSLRTSLDRHADALRLLSDVNIRTYTERVRRMESALFELAQYHGPTELPRLLAEVFSDLSPAHQQSFARNIHASSGLVQIRAADLTGKGATLRRFLDIP